MGNLPEGISTSEILPLRPDIEQPIRDGHTIHAFSSGGGLRVIRIESTSGDLVGYGEAPQIEEALEHAALDYHLGGETYEQQYSGENARYIHYLTGTTELSSPLDSHIRFGSTFDAQLDKETGEIEVTLAGIKFPPEIPDGIENRVTSSMRAEYFEDRGIKYRAKPFQFPGNGKWGISIDVIENPNNVKTSSYHYTKIGTAHSFKEAVDAAFESPEIEIM